MVTNSLKIWAHFKIDFAVAYQEYCESQIRSYQSGYQNKNRVHEEFNATVIEIQQKPSINLYIWETATGSDWSNIAIFITTNSSISSEITATTSKFAITLAEIVTLKKNITTVYINSNNIDTHMFPTWNTDGHMSTSKSHTYQ